MLNTALTFRLPIRLAYSSLILTPTILSAHKIFLPIRQNHNNTNNNNEPNKATLKSSPVTRVPRLIYVQNPLSWIRNKIYLQLLKLAWDRQFVEADFKRGASQATVVMSQFVRDGDLQNIQRLTTPNGFRQITHDIIVSKHDPRLQMLLLRTQDIRRTIPVQIYFIQSDKKRRHCFIDMFMVGLRRVDGLADAEKEVFLRNLRLYRLRSENDSRSDEHDNNKLLFTEMYVRFHKEYIPSRINDWNIAYFKVASFDVLTLN